MKKVVFALFVLLFTALTNSFAQTEASAATPSVKEATDFFAGKWNLAFIGTPNGDAKLVATFVRKDGKLTGELTSLDKPDTPAVPLTNIDEEKDKITISFAAQGYDNLTADLVKVDDDNLKGMLMNMFEAKASRIK